MGKASARPAPPQADDLVAGGGPDRGVRRPVSRLGQSAGYSDLLVWASPDLRTEIPRVRPAVAGEVRQTAWIP
jgi:hypothetical protein